MSIIASSVEHASVEIGEAAFRAVYDGFQSLNADRLRRA
jgi:hypothetical protein